MKYYILSILLIASVSLIVSTPEGFAQVEKGFNYNDEFLSMNEDGSENHRFTTTNERILVNGLYQDYLFTETENDLIIESIGGSVTLNKNSCGFNFYTGGFIIDNPNPLFNDSIVAYNSIVDQYSWQAVTSVNGAICEAYYDQGNNSLVAKRYASGVGFMEYKYILIDGTWKTQLEATNLTSLTNRVFGFDQTIDLNRDTINYGGKRINLDNYSGQTFGRTWLESNNNQGKLINLLNGVNFDFDLGFENLDSISITDTGINKSKVTFHYMRNNNILMPNDTLIIDPTYGSTAYTGMVSGHKLNGSPGDTCPGSYTAKGVLTYLYVPGTTDSGGDCTTNTYYWDLSGVDNASISITNAQVNFDILIASNGGENCEINSIEESPISGYTNTEAYTDPQDGTTYVASVTECATVANGYEVLLGPSAEADILTTITGDDEFGLGFSREGGYSNPGNAHQTDFDQMELQFDYSTTPPIPTPDSIVDLTLDSSTQTTATVSFTPPNLNTGNLTTYTFNLDTPQNNNVQTFFANSTDNPYIITGLSLGTSYSANATAVTEGGANYTLANILNFTTATWNPPGTPTLSASALSDTAIRYTSVPGTAGDNSTIWYGLQCDLNGAGYTSIVANTSYVSFYEYTGLTLGDVNICQWRDGSVDGWSNWSNTATDTLALAILSAQRGTTDPDDHLMAFINMVSGFGGVYFGLGVVPFGIMLIGFMAGKKTVRIFTLATLMLMGIVHASGYYVFPNWYWTLCLLFGLVLIMGRMKSD